MPSKSIAWALLFLLLLSCNRPDEQENPEAVITRPEVKIVNPFLQTLSGYVELNAVTQYQRKSTIRANVTGYISKLNVLPGDAVSAGKILCYISTKEQQALQGIDTSELKGFNRPLAVVSSVNGILSTLSFRSGDFVSEGDVLAIVAEPSSLMLQLNVPFEFRNLTKPGVICEVVLPDGTKTSATIVQQMPSVDVASQTQAMLLRLANNQPLPENMNVIIHIPQHVKSNALCVPKAAVQADEAQTEFWVMKIVNDSLAVKTEVKCGISENGIQEIRSDQVTVNDKIIVDGAYGLADSSLVIITN